MQGSQVRFIGKLDSIGEPDSGLPEARIQPPAVRLDIPEELYQYEPLERGRKQIRLLRLGPRYSEDVVSILELQTFDLSSVPKFYALSYVWGDPKRFMPLPCNGGKILVTANLFTAIQKTLSRFSDVWLWADSICINQEDVEEREHQVSLMGEIYGRATLVVAHMGHHAYEVTTTEDAVPGVNNERLSAEDQTRMIITDKAVNVEESKLNDAPVIRSIVAANSVTKVGTEALEEQNETTEMADTSQPAISLMNYLSRIWSSDTDYTLMPDLTWENRHIPDLQGENAKMWTKLFKFWNEDWFYRSWVLQEAVLGKKVIMLVDDAACSLDFVMEFWDLAKKRDIPEFLKRGPIADEYFRVLHLNPVSGMKTLRAFKHRDELEVSEQKEAKTDLLSLLSLSRVNLASDPRDKIYSLLSLAEKDSLAGSITPDYSESNTTAMLYRTIATKHIKAGFGTELPQYAGLDNKIDGLPSWVPDWSYQSRSKLHTDLYSCSGLSVPTLKILDTEPDKLRVRGAIIDTINKNGMAWQYYSTNRKQEKFAPYKEAPDAEFPPFTDEDGRCLIRIFAKRLAEENCRNYDSVESREAAVARTLVMDCTWRGERTAADSTFLESWKAFERLYGRGPEEDTPPDAKIHSSGIFDWIWDFDEEEESTLRRSSWPFEVAFQEAHKGRRFCSTKGGYMCTTPYDAERGDIVVIFEGFRTPFILRKKGEEWRLVGDCYVHDIMDGELVAPLKNCEVRRNEIGVDKKGEPYALRLASGFAEFQEFVLV